MILHRMLDLELQRHQAMSLSRSWSVLHTIDRHSPLHGETPESLAAKEVELQVLVLGVDDILMQSVQRAIPVPARLRRDAAAVGPAWPAARQNRDARGAGNCDRE